MTLHTTCDYERFTSNVRCIVADQKGNRAGALVGCAHATHRAAIEGRNVRFFRFIVLPQHLAEFRFDDSGRHAIDPNALLDARIDECFRQTE